MKRTKRTQAIAGITCLSLIFSLCCGIILTDIASAASKREEGYRPERHRKVAQDLSERSQRGNGQHGQNGQSGQDTVKVILQLNGTMSFGLAALLRGNGVKVRKQFVNLNTLAVDLPASVVASLESFPEVEFASIDSEVRSFGGHVAHTTGADNVRTMV